MRLVTFTLVSLLAAAAAPSLVQADDAPAVPALVAEQLAVIADTMGVHARLDDVQVTRVTTSPGGDVVTQEIDAATWLAETAPTLRALADARAAAIDPGEVTTPDILAGAGVAHGMFQVGRCDGYAIEPIAEGFARVGGSWDLGVHAAAGVLDGGAALGTRSIEGLGHTAAGTDLTMMGVGQVAITEDHVRFFGVCILTLGMMTGHGVFWFDQPPLPA